MKRYTLTILLLSLFLVLSGCAPKKVTAPLKEYVLPPEDVLKKISRTDNPRDTLKAIAHIVINAHEEKHSMKVALVMKRPSFLRAEAIPVMGPPNFFLSVSKNSLKVFFPKKGEFYIGQATMENIAVFLLINLKVEDIVSILIGTPPQVKGQNITLRGYSEESLYRIDIMAKNKKVQSLWVDPDDNLVKIEVLGDNGKILYMAKLENHSQIGGMSIPGRVVIMTGETNRPSAHISYSDIQLSQDVDASLFDLDIPAGIKPIFID